MIRNFFTSLSLYGILPVFGKFYGLILIPIYTRYFTVEEYGMIDAITVFAILATFLINLEIYSGVGRYYFEVTEIERKEYISTGLMLTIFSSILIVSVLFYLREYISYFFLDKGFTDLDYVFYSVIIWVPLSSFLSYFTVLMRYSKKIKLYTSLSILQLGIRIVSILFFIIFLQLGIISVFIGSIIGSTFGIITFVYVLKKDLVIAFRFSIVKNILRFSLPIVPGLLLVGLEKPLSRYFIIIETSLNDLGIIVLAFQITSLFAIFSAALNMVWRPFLFENINKDDLISNIKKIYSIIGNLLMVVAVFLILFANELVRVISSNNYLNASSLIGILSIAAIIDILRSIINIGPDITKKTKYITFIEIVGIISTLTGIILFSRYFGIQGVPYGFLIGVFIKYYITVFISEKLLRIKFEKYLLIFISIALLSLYLINELFILNIFYKLLIFGISIGILIFNNRNYIKRLFNNKLLKGTAIL